MTARKKVELLAPAGNREKLEIAVHYGADAVYLGGQDFSLRSFADNFTLDELRDAIGYAHAHRVKIYVACNIYPRNDEQEAIKDYLEGLGKIGPDAVIISDPGVIMAARHLIPHIPIHLSTQANTTNYKSALFWSNQGVQRINIARELSLSEIEVIASQCFLEIEAFVHGAMCISYSGRCLLSSFLSRRDSNRGMCSHPCRWKYALIEESRPGQYMPIAEDRRGTYIFNSKDLCMIEYIPEMVDAGISSFKIEGRMKGINYLASTVKVYREAIDTYYKSPLTYEPQQEWIEELGKINHRGYSTGFYLGDPDQTSPNYDKINPVSVYKFVAKVIDADGPDQATVEVRNKVFKDDRIEILSQSGPVRKGMIQKIVNLEGQTTTFAQPGWKVKMTINTNTFPNDLIRRKG
jgi:putative protease